MKTFLSILLLVVLILIGAYFFLKTEPVSDRPPPPNVTANDKTFTLYAVVPKELESFAKKVTDVKDIVILLSKGNSSRSFRPTEVSYSPGQAMFKIPLSQDIERAFDDVRILFLYKRYGLASQRVPLKNALSPKGPKRPYIYSLRALSVDRQCAKATKPLYLDVRVAPEAQSKLKKGARYLVALLHTKENTDAATDTVVANILSTAEVPADKLEERSFTVEMPMSPSLSDANNKRSNGTMTFIFSECDKDASLSKCVSLLTEYQRLTEWVFAPEGLTPPASICPGDRHKFVLAPADADLETVLRRELDLI